MKRQWFQVLTVAVAVALLTSTPGFGGDNKVDNAKKQTTDAKKPVVKETKPATTTQTAPQKPQPAVKPAQPKTNTPPAVVAKPMPNVKTAPTTNSVSSAKPAPVVSKTANSKPVVNSKPVAAANPVTVAKPVVVAKPVAVAKPVVTTKTTVVAKPATTVKPMPKVVTESKSTVVTKTAPSNVQPAPKMAAKIAPNAKLVTKGAPMTTAKSVSTVKTTQPAKTVAYAKQPTVNNVSATKTKVQGVKPTFKAPATIPAKTVAPTAVKAPVANLQLPAGFEKISMTDDQRNKATVIMDRYAPHIMRLEQELKFLKTSRDDELSSLLKPQAKTQLANAQPAAQPKPAKTAVKPTGKK
jgi:hypothetical protein